MSMDSLISASLQQGDTSFLQRLPKFALSDIEKKAIAWIRFYEKKYGTTPTLERFKENTDVPEASAFVTKHLVSSPLKDLYDQVVARKQQEYALRIMHEIEIEVDEDGIVPVSRIAELGRQLSQLNTDENESIFKYDRDTMYSPTIPDGLKTGYEVIDEATGGLMPGEYGILVARTGVGKTFLTCDLAVKWLRQGKRVLFQSAEMPTSAILNRIDGFIGQFNPKLFRTKYDPTLLAAKKEEVKHQLEGIKALGGDLIFPKVRKLSISTLIGMIHDEEPDAVIVDALYLMRDDSDKLASNWERLKNISNELKQISIEENIPIFATSQLKRTGKTDGFDLEDVAYSDALGQDADIVFSAHRNGLSWNEIVFEILKNRNGEGVASTLLRFHYDTMQIEESSWPGTTS